MDEVQGFLHANKYQLGYIMSEASRIWNENVPGGAFTVGECYATVEKYGSYSDLLAENNQLREALDKIACDIAENTANSLKIVHQALGTEKER